MRISDWSSDVCSSDLNPSVARVHLLLVNATHAHALARIHDPHGKLMPCVAGARLTYRRAVAYANAVLAGQPTVLSNGDVSMYAGFDLVDVAQLKQRVYAPARWEPAPCKIGRAHV